MRRLRFLLVLAGTLAIGGCLGGATEPIVAAGTYHLTTINGQALPFTFPNGTGIKSEVLKLEANGTFTDTITRPDGTVLVDVGNYNVVGQAISFADITLGLTYQGAVNGNTLTITFGTFVEVFTKQP